MHECPDCGQACDCDGEDTWFDEAPIDCDHWMTCENEYEEDDDWIPDLTLDKIDDENPEEAKDERVEN